MADFGIMLAVTGVFSIPYVVSMIGDFFGTPPSTEPTSLFSARDLIGGPLWYLGLFGFSLFFSKDSIQGRSLAKRLFKLQVVRMGTSKPAGPIRCVIRNITSVVWPLELIAVLLNPGRRLGDYLADTKLVSFNASEPVPRIKVWEIVGALGFAYAICVGGALWLLR